MASSPRHVAARVTPVVDTRVAHFAPAPSALSGRISVLARVDDGGGARLCPPRALAAAAPPRAFATSFRERPPEQESGGPASSKTLPRRASLFAATSTALAPSLLSRPAPSSALDLDALAARSHANRDIRVADPEHSLDVAEMELGARSAARARAESPPGRHTRREPRRTRRHHARHGRVLRRRLPRSRRPRADRGPRRRAPRRRDSGRPRV